MEQGWGSTLSKSKIEFFAQKTSLFSGRQLTPSLRKRQQADRLMLHLLHTHLGSNSTGETKTQVSQVYKPHTQLCHGLAV